MKIFIDTGVFLSLYNKKESQHVKVSRQYRYYKKHNADFFTSDHILSELYTLTLHRYGGYWASLGDKYLNELIVSKELQVIYVDSHIFNKARKTFLKFVEHNISFTDALSYVLCRDFKMDEIFTLDSDFKKLRLKTSF